MISALKRFLNPAVPILPGKRDIMQMIGVAATDGGWSETEVFNLSASAWDRLQNAMVTNQPSSELQLDEERESWAEYFRLLEAPWKRMGSPTGLNEHNHPQLDLALCSLDHGEEIVPTMSVRSDLETRLLWRQFARSK